MLKQFLVVSIVLLSFISFTLWTTKLHRNPIEGTSHKPTQVHCDQGGPGCEDEASQALLQASNERIADLEVELEMMELQLHGIGRGDVVGSAAPLSGPSLWPKRKGRTTVILVGYPASGIDTIRRIITKLTKSPTFSVYTEPDTKFLEASGLDTSQMTFCSNCWGQECDLSADFPVIVKTFFPSIMMQSNTPEFNKILHVIRNPIDNIASFHEMCAEVSWLANRRRAFEYHVKKEVSEYKKVHDYWKRYQADENVPMMTVRYEDLCTSMEQTVREVLAFLDISYLVSDSEIRRIINEEPCIPSEHIGNRLESYDVALANKVQGDLAAILRAHDYGDLMDEFNEFIN